MKIVGCDLHTRYQQIAPLDERACGHRAARSIDHPSISMIWFTI